MSKHSVDRCSVESNNGQKRTSSIDKLRSIPGLFRVEWWPLDVLPMLRLSWQPVLAYNPAMLYCDGRTRFVPVAGNNTRGVPVRLYRHAGCIALRERVAISGCNDFFSSWGRHWSQGLYSIRYADQFFWSSQFM